MFLSLSKKLQLSLRGDLLGSRRKMLPFFLIWRHGAPKAKFSREELRHPVSIGVDKEPWKKFPSILSWRRQRLLCHSIIFCQRRDHNSSPPNLPDTFFDVIVNVKRDSSTTRWPLGRISRWLLLGWHFKQLSLQDGWAASQECPLWSFSFWPFQKSVPESLLDSLFLMIQLERCDCLF